MATVVRQSKFRHVFGTIAKESFLGVKPAGSALDSNFVKGSLSFLAFPWATGGGGALAVLDYNNHGKLTSVPLVAGHSAPILDFDFSPFNDRLLASGSEDATVKLWEIPEGGLKENMEQAAVTLTDHTRKVATVDFNPTAPVLATSSYDFTIKLWDLEKCQCKLSLEEFSREFNCLAWNYDGSRIATFSKDKMVRVIDPRQKKVAAETQAHQGTKGGRVLWLGSSGKLFTTGFSKSAERQYTVWDPANLSEPLNSVNVDQSAGILMPFYDEDTNLLFLGGKGDGNIRYFEYSDTNPYLHAVSEFKSPVPQKGLTLLPKRICDVTKCEVVRLLKVTTNSVEPIMFNVPRRSEQFQDDLYPSTFSGVPTVSTDDWFRGKSGPPVLMALRPGSGPPPRPVPSDGGSRSAERSVAVAPVRDPSPAPLMASRVAEEERLSRALEEQELLSKRLEEQLEQAHQRIKKLEEEASTYASQVFKLQKEQTNAQQERAKSIEEQGLATTLIKKLEEELSRKEEELRAKDQEMAAAVKRVEEDYKRMMKKAEEHAAEQNGTRGGMMKKMEAEWMAKTKQKDQEHSTALRMKEEESLFTLKKKEEENHSRLRQLKIDIALKDAQIKMLIEKLAVKDVYQDRA